MMHYLPEPWTTRVACGKLRQGLVYVGDAGLEAGDGFPTGKDDCPRCAEVFKRLQVIAGRVAATAGNGARKAGRIEVGVVGAACNSCRCWKRDEGVMDVGRCRRYPPSGGVVPRTPGDDWCGEYRK